MDPCAQTQSAETVAKLRARRNATPCQTRVIEDEVTRTYLPLARHLAGRFVRQGVDLDDLTQVANLALLKAIRRFDPDRGPFEPYATATISGELKRYLRDQCWSIRPPRRVQELHSQIAVATEALAQADRRMPDTEALAGAVDADVSEISEALVARSCFTPSSLDHPISPGGGTLGDLIADGSADFDALEDAISIDQICGDLCESDRELLRLRFFEGKTQREIAGEMGVSQMKVSRRLSRLLTDLRQRVEGAEVA